MSSSDPAGSADAPISEACRILRDAIEDPALVSNAALQMLLARAARLYAVRTESGLRAPFPNREPGVTTDEAMLLATDMLHALNVQLFELSMWQAMTGNCVAPSHHTDTTE